MLILFIRRELIANWRNPQSIIQPLVFFALTLCLFPISLGADNQALQNSAPAALWLALLLATLLGAEQLLRSDFNDGTLSQDRIHLEDLWLSIAAKIIAAWLRFILPLLLCLPLFAFMLHIPLGVLPQLTVLLMLGSLCLLLTGTIGAALTLGESHNSFLLFLIVVPFYIPALIIGVQATHDVLLGFSGTGQMALLGALMLFSLLIALPFSSMAIKAQALP